MVEYIVAIDVTRVRFPADASLYGPTIRNSTWTNTGCSSLYHWCVHTMDTMSHCCIAHARWGSTYSLWGSNPRPMAHKTIALTTELREHFSNSDPAKIRLTPHRLQLYTFHASPNCKVAAPTSSWPTLPVLGLCLTSSLQNSSQTTT